MKTWLIQRASFEDRDWKKGIDSIINLDYMGSSEFEWGALPQSLERIRKDLNFYTYLDVPIKDKIITVFCKNTQKTDVKQYLTDLSNKKFTLKEFSGFDLYINDDGYFKDRFDFWWDIENDMMFWKKNNDFETKFKLKIEKK